MIKAPINLQDLRRRLYVKAKAEPSWRFWGLYVHVCKRETLLDAYRSGLASFPRTPTYAAMRLASASTGDRNPIDE